ncbi:MAG: hypothetical protein KQ78_01795 [Candidatus Izimaplasma bacterium HR2]|nr:MAG: hypothetical protein KQ78_01795 [Candidatus Izimaplasma bacterium HR2]
MLFKKEILTEIECQILDKDCNGFTLIDEGEWVQSGKYQYKTIIFKFEGKYYMLQDTRSGSPFTDWYYDSDNWSDEVNCMEVYPKEVTITVWEAV